MDETILRKLKQIPLFGEIRDNAEYMALLGRICKSRNFNHDTVIIREGEIGAEMYVVFRGSVEIRKKTRAGDDYTVARLKDEHNVFFGELALIDDDKRSATVVASEDSVFLEITKDDFLRLGNENPAIGLAITRAIAKIIASRLRKTNQDMLTIFDALVNELRG